METDKKELIKLLGEASDNNYNLLGCLCVLRNSYHYAKVHLEGTNKQPFSQKDITEWRKCLRESINELDNDNSLFVEEKILPLFKGFQNNENFLKKFLEEIVGVFNETAKRKKEWEKKEQEYEDIFKEKYSNFSIKIKKFIK